MRKLTLDVNFRPKTMEEKSLGGAAYISPVKTHPLDQCLKIQTSMTVIRKTKDSRLF